MEIASDLFSKELNLNNFMGSSREYPCGKSAILEVFSSLGVPCYQSDLRAKELMQEDPALIRQIKALFGDDIYLGKKLDRSKLADLVFDDKRMLKSLNALVHPRVKKDFKFFLTHQNAEYVIKEAAILFETGGAKDCDVTILVTAHEKLRVQRVMKRDNINEEHIKSRMSHQWSDEKKIPLADYVINNIDWDKTLKKIEEIHKKLTEF